MVRVQGGGKRECNGDFYYSGERNERPCFTKSSGAGALYFDGTYWKICQIGEGPTEKTRGDRRQQVFPAGQGMA